MTITSDKVQIEKDTYRIIYQSYQERNNQLSALNHAMVGFTVAFLAVMIGSYSTVFSEPSLTCQNKEHLLFFIIFASIFELTLWRVYANYVDLSIIDCYKKIICCEHYLRIIEVDNLSIKESIKESKFDHGHWIIDFFAYSVGIGICILFLCQISNCSNRFFYEIIFALVLISIAIWIISIKNKKYKKYNEMERIEASSIYQNDLAFRASLQRDCMP